jgi:outer membrane protein OmpA-like peptidoglycan-associated protein
MRTQRKKVDIQEHSPTQQHDPFSGQAENWAPPIVSEVLQADGQPLDQTTRAFMEPLFGHDFSQVRVHTDTQAAESARAVSALAYTVGRHAVFGEGQYVPATKEGRRLLAHELTHVVQQTSRSFADVTTPEELRISNASNSFEHPANQAADAVMSDLHSASHTAVSLGLQPVPATDYPSVQRATNLEQSWSTEHPEGRIDEKGPYHYVLWNFDVGISQLKPEHKEKLNSIARDWQINRLQLGTLLRLDGHASRSGSLAENEKLSQDRVTEIWSYLVENRVDVERMESHHHGFSQPWFPNVTGEMRARNRRVEVRILRPEEGKPEPRPTLKPPEAKPTEQGFIISDPGKLGTRIPNISFQVKVPIAKIGKPVGPYLMIYLSGEIAGKFQLKTLAPGTAELHLKSGEYAAVAKQKLNDLIETKVNSEGKLSLSFYSIPLQPTFEWNPIKLHEPLSLAVSQAVPITELDLGNGLKVEGEVELKIKFGVGPSLGVATAFGTAGVVVSASIVGAVLLAYGTSRLVGDAHEKGMALARLLAHRNGYAWRVAGEAMGDDGYRIAHDSMLKYKDIGVFEDAYAGWKLAEDSMNALPADQRTALFNALKKLYSPDPARIQEGIFLRVGGVRNDNTLPPSNPDDLVPKALRDEDGK